MKDAKPIPQGFHTVTPYLTVSGAAGVIDFLKQVFGAAEVMRMNWPDGSVAHAEMRIGDSNLMLSDARGECRPMPASLYVYVDDVDAAYNRALQAGAAAIMPPADQFYGDRHGAVRDAAGNQWSIATHVEDVAPEEMQRRQEEWLKTGCAGQGA